MKKCECGHTEQWHTSYGCLGHPKGTELLSTVCTCNKNKEDLK